MQEFTCAFVVIVSLELNDIIIYPVFNYYSVYFNYSIIISGPYGARDGKSVHLPPTPGDPTSPDDPTLSDDPSTLQLQPNPSYCLLEMSHQQPISSKVENVHGHYINSPPV